MKIAYNHDTPVAPEIDDAHFHHKFVSKTDTDVLLFLTTSCIDQHETCAKVTYSMDIATMIHLAPLTLMMLVLTTMTKGTGQTISKLLPIAKQAGLSAASFLCAVALPAVMGALRSAISGKSRRL